MPLIISVFSALLSAITLKWLIQVMAVVGAPVGVTVGAAGGIGLVATAMTLDNAFCGWGVKLFMIQAGYRGCYCPLMGIVLAL